MVMCNKFYFRQKVQTLPGLHSFIHRRAILKIPLKISGALSSARLGEDETAWMNQGHANLIMDNMIAESKTEPFIIVTTYGMTNEIKFGGLRNFDIKPFETLLTEELIPFIDSHFRTYADSDHRAMAGLSMGGMETKMITLNNPQLFSYYGLLSGGTYAAEDIKDNSNVKLIF